MSGAEVAGAAGKPAPPPPPPKREPNWSALLGLGLITLSLIAVIVIGRWAYFIVVPPKDKTITTPDVVLDAKFSLILSDHHSIVSHITTCRQLSRLDKWDEMDSVLIQIDPYFTITKSNPDSTSNPTPLTPAETNIVQLSKDISYRRIELDGIRKSDYFNLQFLTWCTILVGMVTTIFVTISTTNIAKDRDGKDIGWIKAIAIALPAVGTALAALSGFYALGDEYGKDTRSLASLGQLHGRMVLTVLKQPCAGNVLKADADLSATVDGWISRYSDIVALADLQSSGVAAAAAQAPNPNPPAPPAATAPPATVQATHPGESASPAPK